MSLLSKVILNLGVPGCFIRLSDLRVLRSSPALGSILDGESA